MPFLLVGEIIVILDFAMVGQAFASVSQAGPALCSKLFWPSSVDIFRYSGLFAFSPGFLYAMVCLSCPS
jgi:hypothetical protein